MRCALVDDQRLQIHGGVAVAGHHRWTDREGQRGPPGGDCHHVGCERADQQAAALPRRRVDGIDADEKESVDIIYLHVSGEGPNAKAWYDGAPSPGVPVQDALDSFAKQGYKVARMTDNLRVTADLSAFVLLLQRER